MCPSWKASKAIGDGDMMLGHLFAVSDTHGAMPDAPSVIELPPDERIILGPDA